MRRIRHTVTVVGTLALSACTSTTECDCVPAMVTVFGTVSGANPRARIDAQLGQGECRAGLVPSGAIGIAETDAKAEYTLGIARPFAGVGPMCVFVTARTLDGPPVTATRTVQTTLTAQDGPDQPRVRVDITFGAQ
jgi:hypothetical protein